MQSTWLCKDQQQTTWCEGERDALDCSGDDVSDLRWWPCERWEWELVLGVGAVLWGLEWPCLTVQWRIALPHWYCTQLCATASTLALFATASALLPRIRFYAESLGIAKISTITILQLICLTSPAFLLYNESYACANMIVIPQKTFLILRLCSHSSLSVHGKKAVKQIFTWSPRLTFQL